MLISDERQVVLNDIVEYCRKMAEHYRENAGLTDDPGLTELFTRIGYERRELAAGLEGHLRRLGWLPAAPDPDAELVEELITRVKIAWSENGRRELLAEMQQAEDRLAALIAAALRHEMPAAVRNFLEDRQEAVNNTLNRLAVS